MATLSDKEHLLERDATNGVLLRILACLSVVFVTVFLSVTFLVLINIQTLDDQDADMHLQIEELKRKLEWTQNVDEDAAVGRDVIELMVNKYVKATERNEDSTMQHRRQTSNIFELILKAQELTFEKYCAPHNATCPQGPRGENGTAGLSGSLGSIGATGLPGDKGIIGDIGINGSKGEVGSNGVDGDIGPVGMTGLQGDKGALGELGVKGAQGLNGSAGSSGKPGMKGDIGDIGLNGSNGQDGVQGIPGFVGPDGDPGLNGTQGPVGPIGISSQLTNDCLCYKKPSFLNPRDETIAVNSITDAVLPCDSTGNPPPVLSLYKPPRKNGRKRIVEHTGNTYTIVKATPQDYGRYICTATNMYGSVSKTVTVMGTPAAN